MADVLPGFIDGDLGVCGLGRKNLACHVIILRTHQRALSASIQDRKQKTERRE
jgi:hypothetical protein